MTETREDDPEREPDVTAASEGSRTLTTILVAAATVIAVLSAVTTWVRTEMLDTDTWVDVSGELLAEPEIQDALSAFLTDELFERVDVQAELEEALPDDLSGLAGPLAGGLRTAVANGVDRLVASDRFASLWSRANRAAHERLVAVLRDETRPGVSTADGNVTLELASLVKVVGENIGIPDSALDRIPDDAGMITVFQSSQLARAQTIVQVLDFLSWFLFVVVVGLYALAVYLARGRRRRALQSVGVGLLVGGISLLLLRALGVQAVVGAAIADPTREPVGTAVGEIATELLRQAAWSGIIYGLLIVGFALLIGDHRWAVSIRGALGRTSDSSGLVVGASIVAVLALMWWSPGRSFDRWYTALIMIALVTAAVVVLFRQVAAERRALAPVDGPPD